MRTSGSSSSRTVFLILATLLLIMGQCQPGFAQEPEKLLPVDKELKLFNGNDLTGQLANHGTECTITEGAIALQSEGTAVEFKDIRLGPLEK